MNVEQNNNNVEGTTSAPVNNPTPGIVPNTQEEMTTAVVNPNFMAEVEPEPAPAPMEVPPIAPEPVVETPTVSENVNPEPEKKKKGINKIVLIVIIVIAVIIVAVGAYAGYLFIGVNPKKVHTKVIDQMFASADKFANNLTLNYNPDAKTIKSLSKITFDTNFDMLSMIKDYSLTLESGIDKVGNYANYKLTVLEKSNELLDMNYYLTDNKMYMDSKDLYDKVIVLGDYEINTSDFLDTYSTFNDENVSYLLGVLKKGFENSFDDGKYDRKLETVKLNGKEVKAFNNSYTIDEAAYYSMTKSILTTIRNDDKAIEILADMISSLTSSLDTDYVPEDAETAGLVGSVPKEITPDYVKELLDAAIKELTDPQLSGDSAKVYFNVYTSMITNEVIGVKLISNDGKESVTYLDYYVDGDVSGLKILLDEFGGWALEITTKGNTSEFKFIAEKETLFTGKVINTENKMDLTLSMDLGMFMDNGASYIFTLGLVTETHDADSTMEIKIGLDQGGESIEVSMKIETTTKYDEQITKPNVSGAVDIDDVDEKKISENLKKALEDSALYDMVSDYLMYSDFDINDDFGDDDDFGTGEMPYDDNDIYSEHCSEANNCKCGADDLICTCRYLNSDFKYEDIICPNPNI